MLQSLRILHIVMLIGVTAVVQSDPGCPYNSTLCSCGRNDVTCVGLQEIPPVEAGIVLPDYFSLVFKDGNITSMNKDNLPAYLYQIVCQQQPLTNISDDAFDNSAGTLWFLEIDEAQFKQLPLALLSLTTLEWLIIKNTPIEKWDVSIPQHLGASLLHLRLINVSMLSWPIWIANFHSLESLDLSQSLLTSIPDDAFTFLKKLEYLILKSTGITHVPQALSNLTRLSTLDLSGNTFVDVSEIEQLYLVPFGRRLYYTLNINSVGLTRNLNLSNFTLFGTINMDNNTISDFDLGSFFRLTRSLSMRGNNLSSVPTIAFEFSEMEFLALSRNQISEIKANAFPSSLTILDLDFNKLTHLTNTAFTRLTRLSVLDLSHNPISGISPSTFDDLRSLTSLDLDSTNLTEIPRALTKLVTGPLQISLKDNPSLTCPDPQPTELVAWFNEHPNVTILGQCKDGQNISSYLYSADFNTFSTPSVATT